MAPETFAARLKVLQHLLAQKKSAGWLSGVTIKSAGGKWDALAKLMSGTGKAVGSTGSKFVKNYAGAGQGGNLAGASLLQHTASPLRPPTPKYWPKAVPTPTQLAHGAAEKLSEAGPIGNAAVVTARAGKNLLTTSPLTPALETIKPGLGRFGAPLTAAGVAGTAGYAGARALPDKVNSLLEAAGVSDPKVLDDQWWSTLKAQPKLLWQSIAPAWAGGDPTKASKVPMHLLKNVVAQANQFNWKAPAVSMKRVLKDPIGTAFTAGLAGDVMGNVDYNTHKGLPATITRTAADAINDGILQDDLTKSPLTNTVRDAVSPRLIEYLKSREGKQQMLGNWLEEFKNNKGVKKSGSTKKQPSAVVIRGNPQHFPADGSADAFYRSLADHVKSLGYSVTEDAGDPKTLPTKADAWIGHSRGAGRFDYAPKGVNLIALGSHRNNAINHPEDKSFAGGKVTPAHFTLTDDMKRLLAERLKTPSLLKGAAIQLFDDEEEDKPVKSKSWLPTLALGAGGVLGGMALGHYLNSKSPAQATPPVTAPQPPAAPPQVPAAAPKAPVQPAVAPPKAPVQPPPAAPQQPQVTTGGIKPPVAPPQPQPAPNAAVATGIGSTTAGPVKATSPVYNMPQGLSPDEQIIFNEPEQVLSALSTLDPAQVTPDQKAALQNMLTQFSEAQAGAPDAQFPNLSELYRAGYAGDQQALQKAKVYQQILSKANQAAYGAKDFATLNTLAERDTSVPPVNNMPVYKLPGLENLSAFGYRDIQSLASAAAEGDPNVLPALRALGREGQFKLFKVLQEPGHRMVDTADGESGASAFLVDPRAAALRGAVIQSGLSEELKPAPYDPTALANAEAMKALSPEQKMQLISDVRNPDVLGKALSSLPPEAKQQAINNLASTFARNAQIRDNDMNLVDVQGYLDPSIQTSLAKLKGLSNYQPLGPDRWRDMSAMGGNLGEFLGPYKIRATNALRTPTDVQSEQGSGPQAFPNYSPTQILTSASPETDQNLVNDWTKVLTSNLRKNYTQQEGEMGWIPKMTNDQLAPMLVSLGRLKAYRPDVYNNVVANLQQQYGKIPGTYSRTDRLHVPAYKDQITADTPMIDYNWEDKLNWWMRQHENGWLNPQTGTSKSLSGLREMQMNN